MLSLQSIGSNFTFKRNNQSSNKTTTSPNSKSINPNAYPTASYGKAQINFGLKIKTLENGHVAIRNTLDTLNPNGNLYMSLKYYLSKIIGDTSSVEMAKARVRAIHTLDKIDRTPYICYSTPMGAPEDIVLATKDMADARLLKRIVGEIIRKGYTKGNEFEQFISNYLAGKFDKSHIKNLSASELDKFINGLSREEFNKEVVNAGKNSATGINADIDVKIDKTHDELHNRSIFL